MGYESTHVYRAQAIKKGEICPYCNAKTEFVDSSEVYGRSYGMIYLCRPCRAWVGVHKKSNKALGSLANAELRDARKEAHSYFDRVFREGIVDDITPVHWKGNRRTRAYTWLRHQLNMSKSDCHIGRMSIEQCQQVIEVCKKVL